MGSKQVIVVRKDIDMSPGKMGGQCAHAAMGVFFNWMKQFSVDIPLNDNEFIRQYSISAYSESPEFDYIEGSFTKVIVEVENEDELLELYNKASDMGFLTSIITDAARTEFTEPTTTCICIGPISDEDCIGLTDHLKLYKDDKANQLRSYEKLLRRIKQTKNVDEIHNIISEYEQKKGKVI